MWHFATKPSVENAPAKKVPKNTLKKLPEIGEKSHEKSSRVPDAGRTRFWPHFGLVFRRFWAPKSEKIGKMTDPGAVRKNVSF